jgi:hypothetical protein
VKVAIYARDRQKVTALAQALEYPETRTEASEALRGLIDAIVLTPSQGEPPSLAGERVLRRAKTANRAGRESGGDAGSRSTAFARVRWGSARYGESRRSLRRRRKHEEVASNWRALHGDQNW